MPALQTWLVPHTVPFGASVDSMQTGVPVLQAMVPRRQGLPGTVQTIPAWQAAHEPFAPHTMSVPHEVPAETFVPVSLHVGAAPEQTSVPVWHWFAVGVQAAPAWQVTQAPAWQTIPVPHVVPFGRLFVSVQTGAPVVQTMLPTRHGLPVTLQAMSATQSLQVPFPQTLSAPHTVPFACRSDSSMQVIAPSLQTNMPLWHGLAGTHEPPATQLLTGTSTALESMNVASPGLESKMSPASTAPVPPVPVVPPTTLPPAPPLPPAPAELPPLPVGPPSSAVSGSLRNPPHEASTAEQATNTVILKLFPSSIRATS